LRRMTRIYLKCGAVVGSLHAELLLFARLQYVEPSHQRDIRIGNGKQHMYCCQICATLRDR
jgi:hypothetical protein